jgi:DNA-binding MarR family transcriptional regulator
MTQIANGLKISVGALTTAMNKLEMKGYVIRARDIVDRRIVNISLSDSGKAAHAAHETFHKHMVEAALAGFSANEKAILLKSLSQLDDYFVEEWTKSRSK